MNLKGLILGVIFILSITIISSVSSQGQSPAVKEGEKLFEKMLCYECHTIAGVGYAVGPLLDGFVKDKIKKEGEKKYKEWLKKFLTNPPKTKPGTPKPLLKKVPNAEEFDKIFEFLKSV